MARGKKTAKELSPEEKLQQALVPVEEQPYSIPENWCWIKLQFVCEYLKAGGDKPASFVEEKDENHLFPVVANGIENDGIIGFTNVGQIVAGTVSVSGRGTIGYSILREYEYVPVVRLIVIKPLENLLPSYLKYVFDVFEEKGTGSSIPQLTVPMVKDKFIPLPPFLEQQRIVDRIGRLLAKLDEAKEKAQTVVDGFELRKSAVLHKAFTGELTERWRKEKGIGLDSWTKWKLKDCGAWCGGGTPSMAHPEYWNEGDLLWVTSKDMKSDVIEDTLMHTNMMGVENSSANYIEKPSVLFVMRSGILRKTLPIAMVKVPFTVNQDLKAISPTDDLDVEYVFWVCKSTEKRMLGTCMKNGTTVESINAKTLMEFEIPIASQVEQKQIVNCIVSLLNREQQAKEAAEAVLSQIDTMKKAILARAFRGELGTNDPAEEWAGKLVKAVL